MFSVEIPAAAVHGMLLLEVIKEMLKTNPTERLTAKEVVERLEPLKNKGKSPLQPVSLQHETDINLQCSLATSTTLDISWGHAPENDGNGMALSSYLIDYWIDDNPEITFSQQSTEERNFKLENLVLDSPYCIQVRKVFKASTGKILYSAACPPFKVRTKPGDERLAHIVRSISEKLAKSPHDGLDLYKLPLKREDPGNTPGVQKFVFGEPSNAALCGERRNRTVLVVGATGSGKTTLINAMVNYILGVEFEDDFRFKLIDEPADKSQCYSQTELITTYDLYEMKGSRLGYSLTVVDTPGILNTSGFEKDMNILMVQMYDYLFQHNIGIQQIEAVCFVVPSSLCRLTPSHRYMYESLLSVFGKDIKQCIRFMMPFSDREKPVVLATIHAFRFPSAVDENTGLPHYYKFNFSSFFIQNHHQPTNRFCFEMTLMSFNKFFDDLSRMETKSLTMTREVLQKRKQFDALVKGLHLQNILKSIHSQNVEIIKKNMRTDAVNGDTMCRYYVYLMPTRVDLSGTDYFSTNCQKCQMTCHFPCRQTSNTVECSIKSPDGRCAICKCQWYDHSNEKHRYEMDRNIRKQQSLSIDQLQIKIDECEEHEEELRRESYLQIRRLNEIALWPHISSTRIEYLDLTVFVNEEELRYSWGTRRDSLSREILSLKKLRKIFTLQDHLVREVRATDIFDED